MEARITNVDPYNEFIHFVNEEYKATLDGVWLRAVGSTLSLLFFEKTGIKVSTVTILRYLHAMESGGIIEMRIMPGTLKVKEIRLKMAIKK